MYGYSDGLCRIDLTTGRTVIAPLGKEFARSYIGGSGLGARLLYDETSSVTDPLGPDNPIIYAIGPFVGTRIPTSGRHAIVTRSPLTSLFAESDSGGKWGQALRRAGLDGIVITGCAPAPVYVWIHEAQVEIRSAAHLWGKDTYHVDHLLRLETDKRAVVSCIGRAGERRVPLAGVMHDGRAARAAGRCGIGAVMGSKHLKAVVVSGTRELPIADTAHLQVAVKYWAPVIREKYRNLHDYGTAGGVVGNAVLGDLPIKNWQIGQWDLERVEGISGSEMARTVLKSQYYCGACVIGCGREIQLRGTDQRCAGPEYEGIAGLGSMCLISNFEIIARANDLCNRYGLDVISVGGVIAFAMEAFERGLVSLADVDGLALEWGNGQAVLEAIRLIGEGEGALGQLLGRGVRRAAESIGGEASKLALHVKGLELPFHDPRALSSLAVAYATHPRGACHRGMSHALERYPLPDLGYPTIYDRFGSAGKGAMTADMQDYMGLFGCLKLCQFTCSALGVQEIVDWLNAVTGWGMTKHEFLRAGERISNLKRMYNVRLGVTRKDDTLPARLCDSPLADGGAAGHLPDLETMLDEYYAHRGWDDQGLPKPERLCALGLDREISDLPSTQL